MTIQELISKLLEKRSYLQAGAYTIAKQFKVDIEVAKEARKRTLEKIDSEVPVENILVIGDLHCPFEKEGYLEFCKEQYDRFNCNKVVFIGDIIDNHYTSYHEEDPNGLGGGDELRLCIERLAAWYEAFPEADVTIGNHDRIIMRKAFSSKIPKEWIKGFGEVLNTPNWNFVTEVVYNDVRYVHGDKSGKPRSAAKRDMISTVSGHYHTDFYCEYVIGIGKGVYAMAVGCGIDDQSYAMGYAAGGKKSALGCAVVLDDGKLPILIPMG